MTKTLTWPPVATTPRPLRYGWRRAAAAVLRSASWGLAKAARRLRAAEHVETAYVPTIEFDCFQYHGGAPEGALYVDGQLVGFVPGVKRL